MANRKQITPSLSANLTFEQMKRGINRLERFISEIDAFDVSVLTARNGPEQTALEATIENTLTSVFGHETVQWNLYRSAARLDNGPWSMNPGFGGHGGYDDSNLAREYVTEGKKASVCLLQSAIKWLRDELDDSDQDAVSAASVRQDKALSKKIFIVHGHDEGAKHSVARFIQQIGFEPVILNEQANQGRTIIEKFEAHGDVGFAVILLTPDDVGGQSAETLKPRARQNVILELGYFIGRLGRARICTMCKNDVELPTDIFGVVWELFDEGGAWKLRMAKELQALGHYIDWNVVML